MCDVQYYVYIVHIYSIVSKNLSSYHCYYVIKKMFLFAWTTIPFFNHPAFHSNHKGLKKMDRNVIYILYCIVILNPLVLVSW